MKIVKQLAGSIKALWHKSPALWSMEFVPSGFALGKTYCCPRVQIPYNYRNPWYNYNFTLYSLQCTPQPTIPTNQSYYSQHTSTHNHSKTMNRELWCVWLERSMYRDGNLRTYCHVSPILFGWFFVEASPTCFCIFVKCFFCNFIYINWLRFDRHTARLLASR